MKKAFQIIIFLFPLTTFAVAVDYNGYFRAGLGVNNLGGQEACTNNSDTSAINEFRWGNECAMYGETTFNFQDEKAKDWKFVTTFSFESRNRAGFENHGVAGVHLWVNRQTYLEGRLPDSDWNIWIGKRFYRWSDIYFMDFFPLDFSAPGFGINKENSDKSWTRWAYLRSANSTELYADPGSGEVATDVGNGVKHMLSYIRENMPLGPGKAAYWLMYAMTPRATKADKTVDYVEGNGFMAAGKYDLNWGQVQHEVGYSYGRGVLSNLSWWGELVTSCADTTDARCQVKQSNRHRGWWTSVRESKDYSWETAVIYDNFDAGTSTFSYTKWLTLGGMFLLHRGDKFSWVLQAGQSNVVKEKDGFGTRSLWRLSGGPEWRWKSGLWSRPLVRGYVAYTGWNQNFRDHQYDPARRSYPFAEQNSLINVGAQMELWF